MSITLVFNPLDNLDASNNDVEYFNESDMRKIAKALGAEIDATQGRFRNSDAKARPEFKLG